ncbi:MAG: DUF2125 domain-containing protein [Hoeflea sp.]|uniref:DUF2125 domain-containing protein n=1 Tax=Hoeflea sp. TaxID=1940281 RepID=UPI0032F01AFF
MPQETKPAGSKARRFVWLAAGIAVFGLAWTAGWHFVADRIEARLPLTLQQLAGQQARAECLNAEIRGYPFRFGLFCDRVSYDSVRSNLRAESGALRSAAQFYRPNHIVSELDGPLSFSGKAGEGRIDWRSLQSSMRLTPRGLDRGSLDSQKISIDIDSTALSSRFGIRADRVSAHARRNDLDADIAVYAEGVQGDMLDQAAFDRLTLEATLPGQATLFDVPLREPQGAFDVRLHRLLVEFDAGTSLEFSGPVQVDETRRISGNINVTVRNQENLAQLAARIDPQYAELIGNVAPMLGAFDTVEGDDAITVPLTIRNGAVSIGIIPLGRLPAF